MKLRIEACAEAEIWQAIEHYEGCREGLGSDFSIEVDACFDWIMQHPLAWPVFDGTARRCQLRRFPYAVVIKPHSIRSLFLRSCTNIANQVTGIDSLEA